jgi:hypothetical protein
MFFPAGYPIGVALKNSLLRLFIVVLVSITVSLFIIA